MSEREQLIELNAQMSSCIKAVERIETALVGDKYNDLGLIHRINLMESKLRKIDRFMWMLIGIFSLGTIPLGTKVLPIIKDYIK